MASLHRLLSQDGFSQSQKFNNKPRNKKVKFKDKRNVPEDSIPLPIYICHDRRSFDYPRQKPESLKGSSVISLRRGRGSGSERSMMSRTRKDEPAIDDVAVKAMISILSGYIGQYVKDKSFRQNIKEKCCVCFEIIMKKKDKDDIDYAEMIAHMEIGIQSIENLVKNEEMRKELDLASLEYIIKIFKIVASSLHSSNSPSSRSDSYLSACAHLYLAIVYKIAKNDKISARYILQVFIDSPFFARTHLVPEVWEHFFLPHLLHLKIWYNKEMEIIEKSGFVDKKKKKKIEASNEQYNDHMDNGTMQFAKYYKDWLKVSSRAPNVPLVQLPSKPSYARSRRRSLDSSSPYQIARNKDLYQEVFGTAAKGRSMDLDNENRVLNNVWDLEEEIKYYIEKKAVSHKRSSSYTMQKQEFWSENKKSDYFKFLTCRTEPEEHYNTRGYYIASREKIENDHIRNSQFNDVTKAISTICTSDSLKDCEMAIRVIGEAWLDSHGDIITQKSLSQTLLLQGIMEVLYISEDDEVLELGISILAELANKSDTNKQCILDLDPSLDIFMRLLRSGILFLKAAILLYVIKPKVNQMMISMEWVPLILRVLEFGDQLQILFSVKCYPHEATYYFLERFLTGFDEDRNLKNANQIVSLGGLGLLVKRMELGDTCEKSKAALVLDYCVKSDGTCRHYLAKNLKKESILSLLFLGKQSNDHEHVVALLSELLCLNRSERRIELLKGLNKGWNSLNTMHILLTIFHRAKPEERPIIAGILLQLDLLGDSLEYSIYREEAIDAIIHALSCSMFEEKIQENTSRALLNLGGHFSYTGEPEIETWVLKNAGFTEHSLCEKDISTKDHLFLSEEDKMRETWLKKVAIALLSSGNKRLFCALLDSIAYSVPRLKRASLVTICWMSSYLNHIDDKKIRLDSCTILGPGLIGFLKDESSLEENILASFSLFNLTKGTDYFSRSSSISQEILCCLHKLSQVTWTAMELISVITSSSDYKV